jgi:hypothetical protein
MMSSSRMAAVDSRAGMRLAKIAIEMLASPPMEVFENPMIKAASVNSEMVRTLVMAPP